MCWNRLALLAGIAAACAATLPAAADPVALLPYYEVTRYASEVTLCGDLSFAHDGECFASNADNSAPSHVSRVPVGGGIASVFGPTVFDPDAVLAADDGGVYVGASSSIHHISWDGSTISLLTSGGHLHNVTFLQHDGQGNLLASSLSNGSIVRVAPDGTQSVAYETGLNEITTFAFDGHGELYVGEHGPRVYRYLAENTLELIVATDHAYASGIMFDERDRMFVTDLGGLYAVDPGLHTATLAVAFDRCEGATYFGGSIYVSESLASEVWRVNVVPEPSSMVLMGSALACVVTRRLRRCATRRRT